MILQEFIQYLKPPLSPRNKLGIQKPYDRGICKDYQKIIELKSFYFLLCNREEFKLERSGNPEYLNSALVSGWGKK